MALAASAEDPAIPDWRRRALRKFLRAGAGIETRVINDICKIRGAAVQLLAVLTIVPIFTAPPALAADEDTAASVYLVFDPDTGEFITVDDPDRSQMHAEQQEAIMSGVTPDDAPGGTATDVPATGDNSARLAVFIAALAAILVGGYIWLIRRRQPPAAGTGH